MKAQTSRYEVLSVDIRFLCPGCNSKLKADVRTSGGKSHCAVCHQEIIIPVIPESLRDIVLGERPAEPPSASMLTTDEISYLMGESQPVKA